jgi:hypothetical protein
MMTLRAITFLSLLLLAGSSYGQDCKCVPGNTDEITLWGLHANVVVDRVDHVKTFRGVVSKGEPLERTLVEVFSDGEVIAMENSPDVIARKKNQTRVASCWTGDDGEFCFDYLNPGTYELRISKAGFETISFIIDYDPRNNRLTDKMIEVEMPRH